MNNGAVFKQRHSGRDKQAPDISLCHEHLLFILKHNNPWSY